MTTTRPRLRLPAVLAALLLACSAVAARAAESAAERDARMKWWREARFGMFIHWGLYAVPAGEWKGTRTEKLGEWIMKDLRIPAAEYESLVPRFNPVKFDAREWVRIAKDAGMKYIVITSKHHDGFALFDSKVSSYDVKVTPFDRDILKELAEACREAGIKLGFYHSIMDWHHFDAQGPAFPDYEKVKNPNWARYVEDHMKPQLTELVTRYGPVAVLWFDGEWVIEWSDEQGRALDSHLRRLQPDLIVNNRIGKGRRGMQGMSREGSFGGDFGTPEQEVPPTGLPGVDWESCMTLNDTWGYKHFDHNWKSEEKLVRTLVDIASKGGNFLLNVGPTAEGLIPGPSVDRLAAMGRWLRINGEAIYATQASPVPAPSWGRITRKPGRLYLHVFDWPSSGSLEVALPATATKAYLLADTARKPLAVRTGGGILKVTLPTAAPDPLASVVVVEVEESAASSRR
jgi:alpha-L-fucosidase